MATRTGFKLRLEPKDEYTHTPDAAANYNESMYFNVFDPVRKIGGWFRLGNRPNEGQAEMTTCLYLPDGRVAFMYGRPRIADNKAMNAGGMRIDVVEPFKKLKVVYDGKACVMARPCTIGGMPCWMGPPAAPRACWAHCSISRASRRSA